LIPLAGEYRIALIGAGPRWEIVKKLAEPYGDRVYMPGNLSRDAALAIITKSRLMVHPAHSEGLARVVIEAFSCGVPVIASRKAMPNAFEHGVQGLLVDPENLLLAAKGLLNEQNRLQKMGKAAKGYFNSTCNEDLTKTIIEKMYSRSFSDRDARNINSRYKIHIVTSLFKFKMENYFKKVKLKIKYFLLCSR
jgi:glycosyltransferase involved in cell wall biosynthesis